MSLLWIHGIICAGLAFLALELAFYWVPLLALVVKGSGGLAEAKTKIRTKNVGRPLHFAIVTACRDGARCIPGFVRSFRAQAYPATAIRLYLVADHCADSSAALARSLDMSVYERRAPKVPGKGNAISEILSQQLRHEAFDALVVLDIDARVSASFLRRACQRLNAGAEVVSCATVAKNPEETLFTHVGALIQALLRLHQLGRQALGQEAVLYGSHGYALSRSALERLEWRTTTGQIAEDMELRLRCRLAGLAVCYAPELQVLNDVAADAGEVREQRRRWNSTYLPLIPQYVGPLMRRIVRGDVRSFDALFGLLLLPSFANLFLYLSFFAADLAALSWRWAFLRPEAIAAAALWTLDVLYFLVAFAHLRIRLGVREIRGFLAHLCLRTLALFESVFFVHVKVWRPASHKEDA